MIEVDKDIALLHGILLGDGCIGKYKGKNKEYSLTKTERIEIKCF